MLKRWPIGPKKKKVQAPVQRPPIVPRTIPEIDIEYKQVCMLAGEAHYKVEAAKEEERVHTRRLSELHLEYRHAAEAIEKDAVCDIDGGKL